MSQVSLHRDDLSSIQEFVHKYPNVDFLTIDVDSSSGIGSIVKVSINTEVNGDPVTITKTLVDESSW